MSEAARLAFLVETVELEASHVEATAQRLFDRVFDETRAIALRSNIDDAERTDAFVARFSRLQDTVGDKLLPAYLAALAEPVGAVVDNLDRVEKLGFLKSADQWLAARKLRDRMVHEYVRNAALLAESLNEAAALIPLLVGLARSVAQDCRRRGWSAQTQGVDATN